MISKQILVGIGLVCLSVTGAAFATDFYVQGEGGYVRQSAENWSILNEKSQPNTYGVGAAAGILFPAADQLQLGAQAGYDYLGESKFSASEPTLGSASASDKIQAVDLLGIAKVPVGQFNIIGGAGAAYEYNKITVSGNVPVANFNGTETLNKASVRPEVMVGGSYDLTQSLDAGLEYKHIFGDSIGSEQWINDQGAKTAVNAVLATLSYHF